MKDYRLDCSQLTVHMTCYVLAGESRMRDEVALPFWRYTDAMMTQSRMLCPGGSWLGQMTAGSITKAVTKTLS